MITATPTRRSSVASNQSAHLATVNQHSFVTNMYYLGPIRALTAGHPTLPGIPRKSVSKPRRKSALQPPVPRASCRGFLGIPGGGSGGARASRRNSTMKMPDLSQNHGNMSQILARREHVADARTTAQLNISLDTTVRQYIDRNLSFCK